MASKYQFESRDERIERMFRDNPGRSIQLCTAVVDGIWDKKRELITSKIPERFSQASLDDLGYLAKDVTQAVEAMFKSPTENETVGIILSGPAGSGKTHTGYAIMRLLAEKNPEMVAFMTTYPQVMHALRQEFSKDAYEELGSMWDKINNNSGMYDGVVFIDDLSVSKQTDFEVDKLTMFLDRRMNEYMPFILTTNVAPENFKEVFGERLASRFMGYCEIILFEERDKRLDSNEIL
jgi:DNA replication protein DnaC